MEPHIRICHVRCTFTHTQKQEKTKPVFILARSSLISSWLLFSHTVGVLTLSSASSLLKLISRRRWQQRGCGVFHYSPPARTGPVSPSHVISDVSRDTICSCEDEFLSARSSKKPNEWLIFGELTQSTDTSGCTATFWDSSALPWLLWKVFMNYRMMSCSCRLAWISNCGGQFNFGMFTTVWLWAAEEISQHHVKSL